MMHPAQGSHQGYPGIRHPEALVPSWHEEFAEDNSFIPENSISGGYLTAQAMLALNLDDTSGFDGHKMIADAYQGDSSKGLKFTRTACASSPSRYQGVLLCRR